MDRRRAAGLPITRWSICSISMMLLLVGCGGRVTSDELPGRWEMRTTNDKQVLQLNQDATFTHAWITEGTRKIGTGEWEFTDVGRAPAILLKYRRDFDGNSSGASLNVVRQWNGNIGLSADPDRRSVFQRRDAAKE